MGHVPCFLVNLSASPSWQTAKIVGSHGFSHGQRRHCAGSAGPQRRGSRTLGRGQPPSDASLAIVATRLEMRHQKTVIRDLSLFAETALFAGAIDVVLAQTGLGDAELAFLAASGRAVGASAQPELQSGRAVGQVRHHIREVFRRSHGQRVPQLCMLWDTCAKQQVTHPGPKTSCRSLCRCSAPFTATATQRLP